MPVLIIPPSAILIAFLIIGVIYFAKFIAIILIGIILIVFFILTIIFDNLEDKVKYRDKTPEEQEWKNYLNKIREWSRRNKC
ncbi:TPA: hypothetical protein CPU00_05420 [Candidatus Gastranaerophilales bacterium HUM_18]|jgi:TRAP-type C4-dicarboxylate transport system permease large subunit|nr:MAG TPA: hypothetical protein CPU00_05420 [Candidatus Gastranaerophilales bacterium HUM_18]